MKKLKLITLGTMMFLASSITHSQVSVSVNLGIQPSWGPVGYSSVYYYYLPDIQAYYDVRSAQFIYLNRGVWIRSRYLPRQYRNYELDRGYKVVLNDYHGSRPYTQFKYHKEKYYKGYSRPQETIGHKVPNHENHDNHENNWNYGNNRNHGHNKSGNEGHGNEKEHKKK